MLLRRYRFVKSPEDAFFLVVSHLTLLFIVGETFHLMSHKKGFYLYREERTFYVGLSKINPSAVPDFLTSIQRVHLPRSMQEMSMCVL